MRLEDGKTYMRADGRRETVMGRIASNYPDDWIWTNRGNWYDRETGRFIGYGRRPVGTTCDYYVMPPSWRDLVALVPADAEVAA